MQLLDPDDAVGAPARRRHRADADDEGRRVPADAASSACARSTRSRASPSAPTAACVIGALTPLSDVERSAEVAKHAGVIVRTMRRLSNVRVRNVATIGGNLAHGDPHMDLPPVLMALDAGIVVVGRGGERVLAVENLFAGYYETVLAPGELITELRIPAQGKPPRRLPQGHHRRGRRLAGARRRGVARGRRQGGARRRASWSAPRPRRRSGSRASEQVLCGATIDDAVLARAGDAAAEEAETVADVRGSAALQARAGARLCAPRGAPGPRRTRRNGGASH